MEEKFLRPYNHKETERKIYARWLESGFFNPDVCIERGLSKRDSPYFSMVLPPPNVTGALHLGHALTIAIEDAMARYHRMKGEKTLWIPGTDHAAIATESKVEEKLWEEDKKRRQDIGRDEFLNRVASFAAASKKAISDELRSLGASLDWSRECYTLDEKRSLAVRTAFGRMYKAGLIYRGLRTVNWDPRLETTVSDDEVEWQEEKTNFYYLKYGPFTIGTARPETKFGDKYIVVHPDDPRYKKFKDGERISLEWINGPITATVVKDDAIEMSFGTGAMTITPWHDAADFEIATRHNLEKEQIIDLSGKLLPIAGEFTGMHWKKARAPIVEKLKRKGLIERVEENYKHVLAVNHRGGGIIEPQVMEQWFVDVAKKFTLANSKLSTVLAGSQQSLKDLLIAAVSSGDVKIIPQNFEKIYFHWIDNLKDWCISRQIWFGHRIPVWYRTTDGDREAGEKGKKEIYVGLEAPAGEGWEQDKDTLDTWFSSGLFTLSSLGWPEETRDLTDYHPTTILETGYDILFFWVARMILMSIFLRSEVPFRTVYLHGLVRDERGRKMSKSEGNTLSPERMIEKYGADAVRISLIIGNAAGSDLRISEDKILGYKHFANKIWNASRYVLSATEGMSGDPPSSFTEEDREAVSELESLSRDVTKDIEASRFYLAAEKLYHYFWHTFADKIIERSKMRLRSAGETEQHSIKWMLREVLRTSLIMLHPFIPYVTEEIYGSLFPGKLLLVEKWPV